MSGFVQPGEIAQLRTLRDAVARAPIAQAEGALGLPKIALDLIGSVVELLGGKKSAVVAQAGPTAPPRGLSNNV